MSPLSKEIREHLAKIGLITKSGPQAIHTTYWPETKSTGVYVEPFDQKTMDLVVGHLRSLGYQVAFESGWVCCDVSKQLTMEVAKPAAVPDRQLSLLGEA
jgi:hypothetical protein